MMRTSIWKIGMENSLRLDFVNFAGEQALTLIVKLQL
jgi:hypothetical protein